ncbi:MAG: MFS transporter [archaeon]
MVKKLSKEELSKIKSQKKKARHENIKEGIFATGRTSFGDYFVSPFAIAINSSSSMVAMLNSISGLLGPISQLFGSRLMEKYSRKKIMVKSVFLESLMWLPLIAISILYYKGILINILPILLLLFFSFFTILANIGSPAFFSWVGDLVEEKRRGRWFAKRTLLTGFISVILAISASFFLDYFKRNNSIMQGFVILFALALFSRLICWKIYKKQYEPKLKLKKGDYFSFWDFIIQAPKNNFGKFSIFRFFFSFACAISSPLLVIYLLRYLNFSYTLYMIIIFSGTIFSLLILELWGKISDKLGSYKTLSIATLIIPIVPLLWIVSPSPVYLIFVPSLISGISWAGFHLTEKNFIYDNVSTPKRGLALSYYNLLWGIGTFLGAGLSAILIKYLTISIIEPIIAIFILSSIARMIVIFLWLHKIKEIRVTKKFNNSKIFKEIITKEARPTINQEIHEIMSIKKYLDVK